MFEIIEAIIGLTLTYIALRYPPVIGCLFLMFSMSQTYGMGAIFPGAIAFIFGLMALLGAGVSFYKIWRCRKRNTITRRTYFISVLAAISTLWTGLAFFAGSGGGIIPIINSMTGNGIFIIIIVLAYWNTPMARKLIVAMITLQMIISVAIIQLPNSPMSIIKASTTNEAYSNEDFDELRLKNNEYIRESGQFLNTLQLSIYSTAGIFIGFYTLFISVIFYQRAVGLVLSLFALQAFYLSFSRGGAVILIISAILLALWQPAKYRVVTIIFIFCITASALLMPSSLSTFSSDDAFLNNAIERASETGSGESDEYRVRAITDSLQILITHPLLGTGSVEALLREATAMPHQAPLNSAVLNGLPDGICVTLLYGFVLAGFLSQIRQLFATKQSQHLINYALISRNEVRLATLIGLLVIIFGMSNQHAGKGFQYVCLGYACLPWIYTRSNNRIIR